MASILDNTDIADSTNDYTVYDDTDGTLIIEFLEDSPLIDITEEPISVNDIDAENPALVEFRSLLFDTVYHQLDIREWII